MATATNPPEAPCKPPTPAQWRIFIAIYESARDCGYQPSQRELMNLLGIGSPNGIVCHLDALERKGWIARNHCESRCVKLLRRPDGTRFDGFAEKP